MTINERVKMVRKELGITMDKFGAKLGVSKAAVSKWESGIANPSDRTIKLMCSEFNVNENWIWNGAGNMFNPEPKSELEAFCRKYGLNELERIVLEKYINLDDYARTSVFNFFSDIFAEVNYTSVALDAPAVVTPIEHIPGETDGFLEAQSRISDTSDAEASYIKSRLDSAQNQERSALNTIADTERKNDEAANQ